MKEIDYKTLSRKERRDWLIERIQSKGLWSIVQSQVGRQFGVSHVTIGNDLKWIKKHYDALPLKDTSINMETALRRNLVKCAKGVEDTKGSEQRDWIRTTNQTVTTITEHLEKFGIKPTAKIDTDQIITVKWGEDEGDSENKK